MTGRSGPVSPRGGKRGTGARRAGDKKVEAARPAWLPKVPWITEEGYLDLTRLPLDSLVRQALSSDPQEAGRAWRTLGSMQQSGCREAGVFLLGLLACLPDAWDRRTVLVKCLKGFREPGCVAYLFGELKRVKGSNTTRRYLDAVLETLASLPRELVEEGFEELIEESGFSPLMRVKFRAILDELHGV